MILIEVILRGENNNEVQRCMPMCRLTKDELCCRKEMVHGYLKSLRAITIVFFIIIFNHMLPSMAALAGATTTASNKHIVTTAGKRTAAIVGGSLGGLAAAHALLQTGWHVQVYERASGPLDQKGSGLGFVHVPAWEALLQNRKPMMRRGRRAHRHQGSFYYGDLWKYLYDDLVLTSKNNNKNAATVHFGKTITEIQGDVTTKPIIDGTPYDLVILCDGGFSTLRKYVLDDNDNKGVQAKGGQSSSSSQFYYQKEPEYAGYVVWRGSIPISRLPQKVLRDIEEGVYKNGIFDTIVLKMAKDNGEDLWTMGTFIATPEEEISTYWKKEKDGLGRHQDRDEQAKEECGAESNNNNDETTSSTPSFATPNWFLPHFVTNFNNVPGLVPLIECMLQHGEIRPHPQYEFGAIPRVARGRVVLLGDAAHMASPRTAVGAHTAILDALALRESFALYNHNNHDDDGSSIEDAIAHYNKSGLRRAHELYDRTREVSSQFVPPGGVSKIVSPSSAVRT